MAFEQIPVSDVDKIALQSGRNRDLRALSMSDCTQADRLVRVGVPAAIAARYVNDPVLEARAIEMLRAAATWVPLQRPGWSLGAPDRTLPTGGDGVNMATSWGVSGILDMLEVLGDRVPPDLKATLDANLRGEIAAVCDTWISRRAWFVTSKAVSSNQWIDPCVALVRACLHLGDPTLANAYELGVANLLQSLDAMGADGAFLEGVTYAQMSLPNLCLAALAMRDAGDTRCSNHPFMRSAWRWFMHMRMPREALVNVSDSHMASIPSWAQRAPLDGISMTALASGDPGACAAVRAAFPEVANSTAGLMLAAAPLAAAPTSIGRWAHFPSQALLVWRADGSPTPACTLWAKGGSQACTSHGHRDAGQVSVFFGGNPVLIECGTPDYADPTYERDFAGAAGHGIMQVRPLVPHGVPIDAPLRVERLDDAGGAFTLDTSAGYVGVRRCQRSVAWSVDLVRIEDRIEFASAVPTGTEVLRWHTGSAGAVTIAGTGGSWTASWPGVALRIDANIDVDVTQVLVPDRVLQPQRHAALLLKSVHDVQSCTITTSVRADKE
jgi:hypothetical protein